MLAARVPQAAHIISKEANGTDDPRNGIAMGHTMHWAFDRGIFTISDQYEVLVHSEAKHSDHKDFEIFGLTGKKIILPDDESRLPHQDALSWHREEIFGGFQR